MSRRSHGRHRLSISASPITGVSIWRSARLMGRILSSTKRPEPGVRVVLWGWRSL